MKQADQARRSASPDEGNQGSVPGSLKERVTPMKPGSRGSTGAPQKAVSPGHQEVEKHVPQPAHGASIQRRHVAIAFTFLVWVVAPILVAGFYLFAIAHDQYASRVGFSVRTEEVGSAIELLGGLTELSGSSSSDTDILYEYIRSQQMVRAVSENVDLREIYAIEGDPFFSLGEDARIEALWDYWQRMVKVFYDRGSGLIEVRVLAFDPQDAQTVAEAIYDRSSEMINELSTIARADAMRYAEEELARSEARLRDARQATTAFRNQTGIIDPEADIQGQMGVVNALQQQLAGALVERGSILESNPSDPRLADIERRIRSIRSQIEAERSQVREEDGEGTRAYSQLIEEFEVLRADQEFAEKSYLSARAARDSALAEAQRQSRYLASYVQPTLAETAEFPQRYTLLGMVAGFLFITWAIGVMVYYSLRDRR
ncbi:sugar transporter [Roseivivax halodurans]|uniref:sugar transporter n=1 Tax=Roseivivax halodurans TaxID=93683 RepID=UPI001FCB4A4B|nr:sugar transporter [Roseivivax halodurans]